MDYAKFAFKTSLKAHNASSSLLNPKMLTHFGNAEKSMWGCSSVGRAPALQAGGQEFDSPHLHHVVMDYARFAFKTSLKAHKASSSLLNPKKLALFGNPGRAAQIGKLTS